VQSKNAGEKNEENERSVRVAALPSKERCDAAKRRDENGQHIQDRVESDDLSAF